MFTWVTEIRALNSKTGKMSTWEGEKVQAISFEAAQEWCDKNRGYLKVIGRAIADIGLDGEIEHYDNIDLNLN